MRVNPKLYFTPTAQSNLAKLGKGKKKTSQK